jgi:hypothetical protein
MFETFEDVLYSCFDVVGKSQTPLHENAWGFFFVQNSYQQSQPMCIKSSKVYATLQQEP